MTIFRSTMFPTAGSQKATKSIVNRFTQASWSPVAISSGVTRGTIAALSGATTANTLKTLLSVSGTGVNMRNLTFRTNDGTSRTIRVKITVDGIVVCDATSSAIANSGDGCAIAGSNNLATGTAMPLPEIRSNSTMLIEYASSLTETDKITAEYIYNTEA